ncbi:MAG: DUF1848 domain-containing protein [Firmicutes bacterium]|nr:DUF1848 domain-containing protein [Bacillota bacterium]
MILSVSRRTDIPYYYSEWFINRLKEGFVYVRNPMNYHQVSEIDLSKNNIDCIVFWTKNAKNIIPKLNKLSEYNYYFQYTLTPYDNNIEKNLNKKDAFNNFIKLSKLIGKHKVILRYDPIIISENITKEYHYKKFNNLLKNLSKYTEKCIISFLDMYKKTKNNLKNTNIIKISNNEKIEIVKSLKQISDKYNIKLESCCEDLEIINNGKCVDDILISDILGFDIKVNKDKNQRSKCNCIESIDIGTYNTCKNNCIYCYSNYSYSSVIKNVKKHNKYSPLLIGEITKDDKIYIREVKSLRKKQMDFLD